MKKLFAIFLFFISLNAYSVDWFIYTGGEWSTVQTEACSSSIANFKSQDELPFNCQYVQSDNGCYLSYKINCTSSTGGFNPSMFSIACPDGQEAYGNGSCRDVVAPVDCSAKTEAIITTTENGNTSAADGDQFKDADGCGYTATDTTCNDTFCVQVVTGTGLVSETTLPPVGTTPTATTTEPLLVESKTEETQTTQNTSTPTETLPDGTTVDSDTSVQVDTNSTKKNVSFDGETIVTTEKDGSTTNTTTTTQTITNPDGTTTVTETTNVTHNTGDTNITTTNINTGTTTNNTTAGTEYSGGTTTVSTYDQAGSLEGKSTTTDSGGQDAEDAIEQNDFGKESPSDGVSFKDSTSDYWTRLNNAPIVTTVSNVSFPANGVCPTGTITGFLGTHILDYHCVLLDEVKATLNLVMLALWGLLGFRIVMSA